MSIPAIRSRLSTASKKQIGWPSSAMPKVDGASTRSSSLSDGQSRLHVWLRWKRNRSKAGQSPATQLGSIRLCKHHPELTEKSHSIEQKIEPHQPDSVR